MKKHMLNNNNKLKEQIMIHIIKHIHYQIFMIWDYMLNMITDLDKLRKNGLIILVEPVAKQEDCLI